MIVPTGDAGERTRTTEVVLWHLCPFAAQAKTRIQCDRFFAASIIHCLPLNEGQKYRRGKKEIFLLPKAIKYSVLLPITVTAIPQCCCKVSRSLTLLSVARPWSKFPSVPAPVCDSVVSQCLPSLESCQMSLCTVQSQQLLFTVMYSQIRLSRRNKGQVQSCTIMCCSATLGRHCSTASPITATAVTV